MRCFRLLSVCVVVALLAAAGGNVWSQLRPAPPLAEHELAPPPWRTAEPVLPSSSSVAPVTPPSTTTSPATSLAAAPAGETVRASSPYDDSNPDRRLLQRSRDALGALPRDPRGRPDWVGALRSGAIAPRAELETAGKPQVLDLDIVMKNTRDMPHVRFPHRAHTEWLACSNCHDQIFVPKAGANPVSMDKIFRGQYCGVCHDRVAFVTHDTCERCHNVVQANGRRWW